MKTLLSRVARLVAALAPLVPLQAQLDYATPYTFRTLAGAPGVGSTDGTGSAARFNSPRGIAVDAAGNLYVADADNHTIRKITPAGVASTFAGTVGQTGSVDGTGTAAQFSSPAGVAIDSTGNVYVSDRGNATIRKISPAGVVTTWAGLAGNSGTADGTGGVARFNYPTGLAVDTSNNVYVADALNNRIRKISPTAAVTTLAGSSLGYADGTGAAAQFSHPAALTVDGSGNVYVTDVNNNMIRKVSAVGVVTTVAGTTQGGFVDATGTAARFSYPQSVAVDGTGNLYVADTSNSTIRKVTSAGVVTTFAGSAANIYGGSWSGSLDGTGNAARFLLPQGVALDGSGNLYVADTVNNTIRKITPAAVVTTLAGRSTIGLEDGPGAAARFFAPIGLATDTANNVYVADSNNNAIRKISPSGIVSTLAGLPGAVPGTADGMGSAARFYFLQALAVDGTGTVYVTDTGNYTIRKVTPAGSVTTFAGAAGQPGTADGIGGAARFGPCYGIALDGAGNVYVAETSNYTIRKITPDGTVTTLAGLANNPGTTDGTGSEARFFFPIGLAVDPSGNIYVADMGNNLIRKITPAGVVTTLTGIGDGSTGGGFTDGPLDEALFSAPYSLALDVSGNLFVADFGSQIIRKISSGGVVSTLAGQPYSLGQADGTGSVVRFQGPRGLACDSVGNLYVADYGLVHKGSALRTSDFNRDGRSDLIWSNNSTGERAMWLMNGGTLSAGASLGTVPTAWKIVGTGDFDENHKSDVLLFNTSTGDRAMWLMDGPTVVSNIYLGNISTAWTVSAVGDFDGDGKADIFWSNSVTGDRSMWLMNGGTVEFGAYLGSVPVAWKVSGTGDFNGDGKADLVWTNTTTGDRSMWLMNGSTLMTGASLGTVPVAWKFSRVGDFDGDGKADIVLSNTSTGDRAMWLLNGPTISSNLYLGNVAVAWTISSTGNFNGDAKSDIFWSNSVTGDRSMWLMNGGTVIEGAYLGSVPVEWVNPP